MQIEFPKTTGVDKVNDFEKISVVIPAYNAAVHLPAALKSILAQSSLPGEIIVVDDGSTDGTAAVAESYGARVISLKNGGPSAARNAGTQAARGEYVAYLDADDLWTADKLAIQFSAMRAHPGPAFSFTDFRMFDEKGVHDRNSELCHHWAFRKTVGKVEGRAEIVITPDGRHPVLYDSYIPPSSVIVRRADALAVGGFDETLRVTEDFEFYLRLFKLVPAIAIMRPLLLYRRHAQQATANTTGMKLGLLDVGRKVAAAPHRYPSADVQYIARTENLRYYFLGIEEARIGLFGSAVASLQRSVAARWTVRATIALLAAQICRSEIGNRVFSAVRAVWKSRPKAR